MKRWLDGLQCLRKRSALLLHSLNQCLGYPGRQANYLFYSICLNQKAGESCTPRQIPTFFQGLNFNGQNVPRHGISSITEIAEKLKLEVMLKINDTSGLTRSLQQRDLL